MVSDWDEEDSLLSFIRNVAGLKGTKDGGEYGCGSTGMEIYELESLSRVVSTSIKLAPDWLYTKVNNQSEAK